MDKKLNEVTKVTDMAYVPVIMADGSIGQIAKSDLASVVAGVMGVEIGSSVVNVNGANRTGTYKLTSSSTNVPSGITDGDVLSVVVWDNNSVYQEIKTTDGKVYSRRLANDSWSTWVLGVFGYNTLADLSSAVAGYIPFQKVKYLPAVSGANWCLLGTVNEQSASVFLYADVTFANTMPALYAVAVYNYNSNFSLKCRLVVGDTGGLFSPNIKYNLEDGIVKIWARGSVAYTSSLLVLTGSFDYKGIESEPPSDAIQPNVDNG